MTYAEFERLKRLGEERQAKEKAEAVAQWKHLFPGLPIPEDESMSDKPEDQDAAGEAAVTRMNISLPVALKAEMDAATGVNWSKVAREAFKNKLLELQSTRKGTTMEDAIKRLRAAAELEGEQSKRDGIAEGEKWAKEEAKPSELKRLLKHVGESDGRDSGSPEYFVGVLENGHNEGAAVGVARSITGQSLDWDEASAFWRDVLGEDGAELMSEEAFATGFVTGALNVWGQVRNHL